MESSPRHCDIYGVFRQEVFHMRGNTLSDFEEGGTCPKIRSLERQDFRDDAKAVCDKLRFCFTTTK